MTTCLVELPAIRNPLFFEKAKIPASRRVGFVAHDNRRLVARLVEFGWGQRKDERVRIAIFELAHVEQVFANL